MTYSCCYPSRVGWVEEEEHRRADHVGDAEQIAHPAKGTRQYEWSRRQHLATSEAVDARGNGIRNTKGYDGC